ncbi:uncharacterized protein (DUF2345 family), partial [Variovorax boronicumulans]
TAEKIQAQLKSDHQSSSLSLGAITRIEDNAGRKDPRGEGFELRTDAHGVLRAQDGMLITTEARGNAANHAKDMGETTQRLKAAQDQHDALAEAAQAHKAQEQGIDQDIVQKALKAQNDAIQGKKGQDEDGRFPELNEPHLVLASPAGIEASTPGSIHLHTGEHTAFTSQGHTSVSTAKRWLASAAEGIRAFTHKKGIKLIASEEPIEIQAHRDEMVLVAHKDVVIKSVEGELHITAKKKVVIIGGGSYSEWSESGIKHGTAGTWQEHAALHAQVGPMSRHSNAQSALRSTVLSVLASAKMAVIAFSPTGLTSLFFKNVRLLYGPTGRPSASTPQACRPVRKKINPTRDKLSAARLSFLTVSTNLGFLLAASVAQTTSSKVKQPINTSPRAPTTSCPYAGDCYGKTAATSTERYQQRKPTTSTLLPRSRLLSTASFPVTSAHKRATGGLLA